MIWDSNFAGPITCKVISIDHYKAVIVVTARKNKIYSPGHRILVPIAELYDKYYPRKHGGIVKGKKWLVELIRSEKIRKESVGLNKSTFGFERLYDGSLELRARSSKYRCTKRRKEEYLRSVAND